MDSSRTGTIVSIRRGIKPGISAGRKSSDDALNPDRIIIGSNSKRATNMLQSLYQSVKCPIVVTTPRTAELIKYASNAFRAIKISYVNELARFCE